MALAHFFIDHPRFATVVNVFITLFGLATLAFLPVAQYPNIVPPTIQTTTNFPGASAETIARLADRGKDISGFFKGQGRMIQPIQRVNVDLTAGMLEELDQAAMDLNISRQHYLASSGRQLQYKSRR